MYLSYAITTIIIALHQKGFGLEFPFPVWMTGINILLHIGVSLKVPICTYLLHKKFVILKVSTPPQLLSTLEY